MEKLSTSILWQLTTVKLLEVVIFYGIIQHLQHLSPVTITLCINNTKINPFLPNFPPTKDEEYRKPNGRVSGWDSIFRSKHPFIGKKRRAVTLEVFSGGMREKKQGLLSFCHEKKEEVWEKKRKKYRAELLLTTMCAGDGDLASLSACLLWRPPGWTSSRGHFICRYWMAERKQNGKKETKHVNNAEIKKEQIKSKTKKGRQHFLTGCTGVETEKHGKQRS